MGAKEKYAEAIKIFESASNEDDEKLAASYANLGGLYHADGNMKEAKVLYEKALQTFSTTLPEGDKSIKDLELQLKLIEFNMTMPELIAKLEAGESLPEQLVEALEKSFGSKKKEKNK